VQLFSAAQLRAYQFEHWLGAADCDRRLDLLRKLTLRRLDGTLAALSETKVEQSFNERLFAEIFDYRTLFRSGKARYHLRPKTYNRKSHRYDDFSLGFFGPARGSPVVTAELKSPDQDLDAPQTGGTYEKLSAVDQAHRMAAGVSTISWVIVSNFDEIRLYRAGSVDRFEKVILSNVVSHDDVRRLWALFGRESLLGNPKLQAPLLSLDGGRPMVLPAKDRHVRIIHEARAVVSSAIPLYRMDEGLRQALQFAIKETRWHWPRLAEPVVPEMDDAGDRLVVQQAASASGITRIELTTNGVLRLQEYLPPGGGGSMGAIDGHRECFVEVDEIARRMLIFKQLVCLIFKAIGTTQAYCRWTIHEATRAVCVAAPVWTGAPSGSLLMSDRDLCRSMDDATPEDITAVGAAAAKVGPALRELMFPFLSRVIHAKGPIARLGAVDDALAPISRAVVVLS
jgi:hypothetical protein